MAQQTIKDAIGAAIQTLLQALAHGGLSMVQRPTSGGMPSSPQNQSCYILQGDLRPPEDGSRMPKARIRGLRRSSPMT